MASGSKERRALRSADTIHQDQSLESSPGPVTSDIVPATLEAQKGPTNPTPFSPQKSGPKELRELWAKESFPRLRSRSGGKVAGICKKYRAKKRATRSTASTTAGNQTSFVRVGQFPFFRLPAELRDQVFDEAAKHQSTEKTQEFSQKSTSPTYIVKQVYKSGFYQEQTLKKPPYGPDGDFLETRIAFQLVSTRFKNEYYGAVLRNAFESGSTIRTTVADLNFDFVTAFLTSLTEEQVKRINNKQVSVIINFELEGLTSLNLEDLNLVAFNKIILDKFRREAYKDHGHTSGNEDDDDDEDEAISHNICFKYVPSQSMEPPVEVDLIGNWWRRNEDEMCLVGPFFQKWQRDHPFDAE